MAKIKTQKLLLSVSIVCLVASAFILGCAAPAPTPAPAPAPAPTPAPAAEAEVFHWRCQTHDPTFEMPFEMQPGLMHRFLAFAEQIKEASQGRIIIDMYEQGVACTGRGAYGSV